MMGSSRQPGTGAAVHRRGASRGLQLAGSGRLFSDLRPKMMIFVRFCADDICSVLYDDIYTDDICKVLC